MSERKRLTVAGRPRPFSPNRVILELPEGLTLLEIAAVAVPDEGMRPLLHIRIGDDVVPREAWPFVRPKAAALVTFAVVPQSGGVLRTVAIVGVLALATAATGGIAGMGFAGAGLTSGMAGTLITVGGRMAVNALVPP